MSNKINNKGFYSEKPIDNSDTVVDTNIVFNKSASYSKDVSYSGKVVFENTSTSSLNGKTNIENFASVPKHHILFIKKQSFTGSVHRVVTVSGSFSDKEDTNRENIFNINEIWDSGSNKFIFSKNHAIYTIRVDGVIPTSNINKNTLFHMDFAVSGTVRTDIETGHGNLFRNHRQAVDRFIFPDNKINADHVHFHAVYIIHTDEHLIASGAQLYAATSNQSLDFVSGVVLFKEG